MVNAAVYTVVFSVALVCLLSASEHLRGRDPERFSLAPVQADGRLILNNACIVPTRDGSFIMRNTDVIEKHPHRPNACVFKRFASSLDENATVAHCTSASPMFDRAVLESMEKDTVYGRDACTVVFKPASELSAQQAEDYEARIQDTRAVNSKVYKARWAYKVKVEADIVKQRATNDGLRSEISRITAAHQQLEARRVELVRQVDTLRSRLEALIMQGAPMQGQLESLLREVSRYQGMVSNMESQLADVNRRLGEQSEAAMNNQLSQLEASIRSLQSQVAQQQAAIIQSQLPTSTVTWNAYTAHYFSNPNMPYLNSSLGYLNMYITKAWASGKYSNRTYAPVSTVLLPYGASHYNMYGSNWETSWWLLQSSQFHYDILIIEFDMPRYVSRITALNYETYSNYTGSLHIWNINGISGSHITAASHIASINLQNNYNVLGSATVGRNMKYIMFTRDETSMWSKLENIRIE